MFKKYKPFFKAGAMNSLAYRFQIFTWLAVTVLEIACVVFLWIAIYQTKADQLGQPILEVVVNGFSFKEIITYLVFTNIFTFVTFGGDTIWNIMEDIKKGTIDLAFTKPISYRKRLLAEALGNSIMPCLILGLPLFTISYIIFVCVGFIVIPNIWTLLFAIAMFLVMQVLAALINDAIAYLFGILCFYTSSGWGLSLLKTTIVSFLSGSALPLAFFPPVMKDIVSYMPFAGMTQNPVLILLMKTDPSVSSNYFLSSIHLFGIALVWYILLELLNKAFFAHASKKITVQGG